MDSGFIPSEVQERIKACERVCVFTGAGVSAESGIPTFRDAGGLWEEYRAEDLVTPEAFARDPALVWRWHIWLQSLSFNAEPNPGHKAIADMDDYFPEFLVITQNIDDLHERAGTKRMIKLHGDIMEIRCLEGNHISRFDTALDADSIKDASSLPKCPVCGAKSRPNVVWFGEYLAEGILERGREFAAMCDLLVIVGTSGVVSGGYGFSEQAKHSGALIIEVNPQESALSHLTDYSLRLPASEALPMMFK